MGWMALVNKRNQEVGLVGDEAWDLAQDYINKMVDLYHSKWGRLVTLSEIISCVEFSYGGTPEEYQERYPKNEI